MIDQKYNPNYLARFWFPALNKQATTRKDTIKAVLEIQTYAFEQNNKISADTLLRFIFTGIPEYWPCPDDITYMLQHLHETKPELVAKLKELKFENDLME